MSQEHRGNKRSRNNPQEIKKDKVYRKSIKSIARAESIKSIARAEIKPFHRPHTCNPLYH